MKPLHVSIVVPICNEEQSVEQLVERVTAVFKTSLKHCTHEILMIDDGSTDGTRDTLQLLSTRYKNLKAVFFRRNFGKAAALGVGFKMAQGDIIVTIDGDLQDPPEEIPLMIAKLEEGYDLVSGWKKERKDPFEKRFFSKIFNGIVSRTLGVRLHDFNCGFKAYRAWCVRNINLSGSLYRFLPVFVAKQGGKITELPISHQKRQFGKSKYGFSRYYQGFFDIITMLLISKFFFRPMHFFGFIALPILGLGAALSTYLVGSHVLFLLTGDISFQLVNRPLLIISLAMLGFGLNIILIGALSEFLLQLNSNGNSQTSFYSIEKILEGNVAVAVTPSSVGKQTTVSNDRFE